MLTCVQAVHTCHATAIVHLVMLTVDTRSLAFLGAKATTVALALVYPDFHERETGEITKNGSHRTDGVTPSASATPREYEKHDKGGKSH